MELSGGEALGGGAVFEVAPQLLGALVEGWEVSTASLAGGGGAGGAAPPR